MMPVRKWNVLQAQLQASRVAAGVAEPSPVLRPPRSASVAGSTAVGPEWPASHFGRLWQHQQPPVPGTRDAHVKKAIEYICRTLRSCDLKNLALHVLARPCGCNDNSLFALPPVAALPLVAAPLCKNIDNKFSQKKLELVPSACRCSSVGTQTEDTVNNKRCVPEQSSPDAKRARSSVASPSVPCKPLAVVDLTDETELSMDEVSMVWMECVEQYCTHEFEARVAALRAANA
jgi:hypothetical protein